MILAAANMVVSDDIDQNLDRLVELCADAAAAGANLLVLPEAAVQGYPDFSLPPESPALLESRRRCRLAAETIPGPATERIAHALRGTQLYVQVGLTERGDDQQVFNSVAIVGPDGVLGRYRKLHNQAEAAYFAPGGERLTAETPWGVIGSLICYDLCFPELSRCLALEGAAVLLVSAAWPMKGTERAGDHYAEVLGVVSRATAFTNQCWVVVSNYCGTDGSRTVPAYAGESHIVDPDGNVVARLGGETGVVLWDVGDLGASVRRSRQESFFGRDLQRDRRPGLYHGLEAGVLSEAGAM